MALILTEPKVPDSARYPIRKAAVELGIDWRTLTKRIDDGLIRVGYRREGKDVRRAFVLGSEIKRYWRSQI